MLKFLLEYFCFALGVSLSWPVMLLWNPNWQREKGRKNMTAYLEGVSFYRLFSGGVNNIFNSFSLNLKNYNQGQLFQFSVNPMCDKGSGILPTHLKPNCSESHMEKGDSMTHMQTILCILCFCYLLGTLCFTTTLIKCSICNNLKNMKHGPII